MADTYGVYRTDRTKEEEGAWVTMLDGSQWKVARANSRRAINARNDAQKPYKQMIQKAERLGQDLPEDVEEEISMAMTVHGIVLDWSGVTDPEGNELDCTEQNVRQILGDLPDLHIEVIQAASNMANFHADEQEKAGKN